MSDETTRVPLFENTSVAASAPSAHGHAIGTERSCTVCHRRKSAFEKIVSADATPAQSSTANRNVLKILSFAAVIFLSLAYAAQSDEDNIIQKSS